jgi:hypothetical protein
MISPEESSRINADYVSKLGSIRTNSDVCNSYYNNLFDLLEMKAAKDYKKENKKTNLAIALIIIGAIILIGSAIVSPIFVWSKSHSVPGVAALVIFGLIEFVVVCFIALDLLADVASELAVYDDYWDGLYADVNSQMINDIWMCKSFELLAENPWIREFILDKLKANNISDLDITDIAQWIVNRDELSGKQFNKYTLDNYNVNINIDDNIDILDIIDSMFEKEGISADENIKR